MKLFLSLAVLLAPGTLIASQPPKKGGLAVPSTSNKSDPQKKKQGESSSQPVQEHPAVVAIKSANLVALETMWDDNLAAYRDEDGRSLLQIAVKCSLYTDFMNFRRNPSTRQIAIIRFLLEHGVDPDLRDTKGTLSARAMVERRNASELLELFNQVPARSTELASSQHSGSDVQKKSSESVDSTSQASDSFINLKNVLLSVGVIGGISAIVYWARSKKVGEQSNDKEKGIKNKQEGPIKTL
jgi:hypothetical protein